MSGKLWEPFQIGRMELKNRIVQPAMGTNYSRGGYVTERIKNHYGARANGGAGLIILEITYVHPRGQVIEHQLGISDDKFIPGLRELAQVIHKHGAKAAIQLHHGGRIAKSSMTSMQPVAPSPVPLVGGMLGGSMSTLGGETPKQLTIDEIAELVVCYAEGALRAKKAGFDGVELHCAHGYLINQFLSRSSNKRQDGYGGDLQNRSKFLIEIIRAIKKAAGADYPVWCRINGKEFGIEEGNSLDEAKEIARLAQDAGADAIHVTAHGPTSPINLTSPTFVPGVIADLAGEIKKAVSIPVIVVAKITPEEGERILAEGKADLIAVGRKVLADPDFWNKASSDRLEDINPCILCMGCRDDVFSTTLGGIRCSVNATLGKEMESVIIPTKKPKKVLVIGGGPAGMEAARVAVLRGHKVTILEKEGQLGGQLIQAAIPPHKGTIEPLRRYLETQLKKHGVNIELNKEATASTIGQFRPEVVVLATGGIPFTPDIPGLNQTNAVHAGDVLQGRVKVGNKVVLIGGGLVGCEVAEFLVENGKKVTVTNILSEMALGVVPGLRTFFLDRLSGKGVTLLTSVKYNEVTSHGVVLTTKEGAIMTIEADTIVLAAGTIPDRKFYEEVREMVAETYWTGNCISPRMIRDAIAEGYRIGLTI